MGKDKSIDKDVVIKAVDEKREAWEKKAFKCPASGVKHVLIPVAWASTNSSKQVTDLMCTNCFQPLTMSDAQNYGWPKK